MSEKRVADSWKTLGLGRLSRMAHTRRCLLCKAVLEHCTMSNSEDYLKDAVELVRGHQEHDPGPAAGPFCRYADCVHHERMNRAKAMAILRVGGEPGTRRDVRGMSYGSVNFVVKPDDHPEGFDMSRQDAVHRHFRCLPLSAGCVYVRIRSKVCEVHVWVSPAFRSRREAVEDPAALWEIQEVYGPRLAPLREWVLKKWNDLKGLVEMDLDLESKR